MYQNIKVSNKITAFFSTGICGSVAPPLQCAAEKKQPNTQGQGDATMDRRVLSVLQWQTALGTKQSRPVPAKL